MESTAAPRCGRIAALPSGNELIHINKGMRVTRIFPACPHASVQGKRRNADVPCSPTCRPCLVGLVVRLDHRYRQRMRCHRREHRRGGTGCHRGQGATPGRTPSRIRSRQSALRAVLRRVVGYSAGSQTAGRFRERLLAGDGSGFVAVPTPSFFLGEGSARQRKHSLACDHPVFHRVPAPELVAGRRARSPGAKAGSARAARTNAASPLPARKLPRSNSASTCRQNSDVVQENASSDERMCLRPDLNVRRTES
jgi:hypothetical protein